MPNVIKDLYTAEHNLKRTLYHALHDSHVSRITVEAIFLQTFQ